MVLAFAGDSTITKFFAICAMFVQILRKIRKTDCNTELFSTFLLIMYIAHILNRSYHVEFLSHILPNAFLLYYSLRKS